MQQIYVVLSSEGSVIGVIPTEGNTLELVTSLLINYHAAVDGGVVDKNRIFAGTGDKWHVWTYFVDMGDDEPTEHEIDLNKAHYLNPELPSEQVTTAIWKYFEWLRLDPTYTHDNGIQFGEFWSPLQYNAHGLELLHEAYDQLKWHAIPAEKEMEAAKQREGHNQLRRIVTPPEHSNDVMVWGYIGRNEPSWWVGYHDSGVWYEMYGVAIKTEDVLFWKELEGAPNIEPF